MKKKSVLMFALMMIFSSVGAHDLCGVYVNKSTDMYEDQYLIVEQCPNGGLTAVYYGTTDDFDDAREGYLPGFFVSKAEKITVSNVSVDFTVNVNTTNIFAAPVPLTIRSVYEAGKYLKPWTVYPVDVKQISYKLVVYKDSLVYKDANPFKSKSFVRVTDKRILQAVASAKEIQESYRCNEVKGKADIAPQLANRALSFEDYIISSVSPKTKTGNDIPVTIGFTVRYDGSVGEVCISSKQKLSEQMKKSIEYYVKNSPAWIPGMLKVDDSETCSSVKVVPTSTRLEYTVSL